ncbi:hypothetical protein WMY93_000241 [Mugilogobius chulae]|uniref:Uncharacterized protein n=1 Tax=Mugilogobius chulae TaxID=88201 RepID=A0AAW0PZT1_9GOBI
MWDEEVIRNTSAAQDWTQVFVAVRWIQIVVSSVSVLGSSSIIVCVMSQRLRTAPELFPLLWLSLSDLFLSLFWLLGAAILNGCFWLRPIEQVLYLSSFCLTLNLVWSQFCCIRTQFTCSITGYTGQISNRVSCKGKMAALLCGVVPVLLMTPVFVQSERSRCQTNNTEPFRCLMMDTGAMFVTSQQPQPIRATAVYSSSALICCFLLTLAGITGLMVRSRTLLKRTVSCGGFVGHQQRALLRDMDRRMVLYPLVFFCCWGPAAVLALLRLISPSITQGWTGAALYITQSVTSGSQGWVNSLVYGSSRFRVHHRDVHTQTPLLRNQKRRGYDSLRSTA